MELYCSRWILTPKTERNKAKAENQAQETLVSNNKENTQTPINKDKNVPTPEAKETPASIKAPQKTETKTPKHAETKENASKEDKEKLSQEIKELEEKIELYNTKLSIHQNILSSEETIAKYEKDIKNKETNIKTNEDQIQSFKKAFLKKNAWNGMYLRSSYSEMFAKLYCNYRFPKDVYNYLTYMGKLIGQSLAKTNINTSEFALNIGTKRAEYGNIVSKEVLETLFPGASDYQGAIHPVSVEDIGSCYGITNNENIKLTPRIQDDLVKTIIHETIHAYGQAKSNTFSEYLYDSKIYPLSDNKDVIKSSEIANFYSVLIWNNLFYGVQGNFDEMHPTNAFQTYRGQPKERMANLVGTIAERTYRQITNQDYERNSVDLYNYTLPKIGALDSIAFDKEKKIVIHKYKATEKLTLDKVKDVFKDADELFKKELNIRQEGEFICYSVSNNWSFRSKLLNFMKKQKRKEAYQKASKEIMQQRAKQK